MRSTNSILFVLVASATLSACDYLPTTNPDAEIPHNVISGTVVADGIDEAHTVAILVTDAHNPGPPIGTGSPLTIATINADEFTGVGAGLQSADYTITNVPDGDYILTAVMDMDENFHPRVDAMAGSTAGDFAGAHLTDIVTQEFATVSVRYGEHLDDVTIAIARETPVQRPAFTTLNAEMQPGRPTVSLGALESGVNETVSLASVGIHAQWLDPNTGQPTIAYDLPGPYQIQNPEGIFDYFMGETVYDTAFFVHVKDADMDGMPDDHPDYPGLGLLDIWPRVYLIYQGKAVDKDDDGIVDDIVNDLPGEKWAMPVVASPVPAMFGLHPIGTPILTTSLTGIVLPAAAHDYPSEEGACIEDLGEWYQGTCSRTIMFLLDDLPRGAWGVTVISETGQTWSIPNEIAPTRGFPTESTDASFDAASQLGFVWVTD